MTSLSDKWGLLFLGSYFVEFPAKCLANLAYSAPAFIY